MQSNFQWKNKKKFLIRFSIANFIANISLYALSWPKLNFGCYLTFEIIFKALFHRKNEQNFFGLLDFFYPRLMQLSLIESQTYLIQVHEWQVANNFVHFERFLSLKDSRVGMYWNVYEELCNQDGFLLINIDKVIHCVVGLEKIDTQKYYHAYTLLDFRQLWSAKLKRQKIRWNIVSDKSESINFGLIIQEFD